MGEGLLGRLAATSLVLLTAAACPSATYQCSEDAQCPEGSCVEGACAFADDACASGMRFGAHSAGGLGGECVPVNDGTTTVDPATGPQSSSSSGNAVETSSSGSSVTGIESSSTTSTDTSSSGAEESSSTGDPPDPDLVAWFSCEGEGPAIGVDATGNGHDGICQNCPSSAPGAVGQSCEFDGGQFLVVPGDPALRVEELTLAAWLQVDPLPDAVLFSAAGFPLGVGTANSYQFGFNGLGSVDQIFFCYGTTDNQECINDTAVIGDWVHVAVTSGMAGTQVYIDGLPAVPGPAIAFEYGMEDFLIGLDIDSGEPAHPFVGRLDELRVYSRTLTDDEVLDLATL